MANAVSLRSRSVRAAMQSSERHQTGAHADDSASSERLLPERGRQDHAGQQRAIPRYLDFTTLMLADPSLAACLHTLAAKKGMKGCEALQRAEKKKGGPEARQKKE